MTGSTGFGWYYFKTGAPAGQQAGPVAWAQLHALSTSGWLAPTDLVWHPSLPQWLPAAQVPGLQPMATYYPAGAQLTARPGAIRVALAMILNPGQVLKGVPWPFCIGVSGLAFAIFFLQTALDLRQAGTTSTAGTIALTAVGFGLGTIGIAIIAVLAWALARPLGHDRPLEWTVRAFCLSYTPTLIFVVIGLAVNLVVDWRTAVCFGVTGALWALHPMLSVLKEMTGHKLAASLVLVTVCGGLIIGAWAYLVGVGWTL